jgi:dienelactone hydrolase
MPYCMILITILLVLGTSAATAAAAEHTERVTFESLETYPGAAAKSPGEVTAFLTLPEEGDGPFPAVIMMHGCSGLEDNHTRWARLLADWGYASLRVDSFSPREIDEICTDILRPVPRGADVNGAIAFLQSRPQVDATQLVVMGWSHGGSVTLQAAAEPGTTRGDLKPAILGAIAIYPYCIRTSQPFRVPLLVLIGDADDWTPMSLCESMADEIAANSAPVDLVVYPGATHSYDCHACNGEYFGHTLTFNEPAYVNSVLRVQAFLAAIFAH